MLSSTQLVVEVAVLGRNLDVFSHFVKGNAQTENICSFANSGFIPAQQLRSHVTRVALHGIGVGVDGCSQTKITHFQKKAKLVFEEEDIAGLDVQMQNTVGMNMLQRLLLCELTHHPKSLDITKAKSARKFHIFCSGNSSTVYR